MKNRQNMTLHFVGIGGIGMSGIAEVFIDQGFRVTGSDLNESEVTRRLVQKGAKIFKGHDRAHLGKATVVVISSAVGSDNPEVVEARRRHIPVIPRAEMLAELMRGKTGIAVAGSHGKTTTTSMLASVLSESGQDPTVVIGGIVHHFGTNARLGTGSAVLVEADESDGSFLYLPTTYAVITNIDNDHLDHFKNIDAVDSAFIEFASKIPFYGLVAVCGDDPGVRRCIQRMNKPLVTYGFGQDWDYTADLWVPRGLGSSFVVRYRQKVLGELQLSLPGKHNVLNALAAVAIGTELDISFDKIAEGLRKATGVKRRFEICWRDDGRRQVIVDDYGHHPTEIAATLAVARAFWPGRIITVFQPHRYTRTFHCRDGFRHAFEQSDVVLISDIYSAGEEPMPGVSSESLVEDIRSAARGEQVLEWTGDLKNTANRVTELFSEGDLILCMGAGSITRLPKMIQDGATA